MYSILGMNKLICKKQFGMNHSTSHALINMSESIKDKLDTGHHVGGLLKKLLIP